MYMSDHFAIVLDGALDILLYAASANDEHELSQQIPWLATRNMGMFGND